jgi:electron transport complex protein RnfE
MPVTQRQQFEATMNEFKRLSWQGLWKNNPALVQLLGLCPLLAVTATLTNGLGLGLATTLVLVGSNTTVSIIRNIVPNEIRIPIFVMIIAAFVTIVQLLMNAYTFRLYQALGIFIPLIVTNCAIIGRAEAYASKNPVGYAAFDGLMMGLGFTFILVVLGAMREVLGYGTLFAGAELLLGDWASNLKITVFTTDTPFLLAILPPGAFLGMGLLIAVKNLLDKRLKRMFAAQEKEKVVQRARVTAESSST